MCRDNKKTMSFLRSCTNCENLFDDTEINPKSNELYKYCIDCRVKSTRRNNKRKPYFTDRNRTRKQRIKMMVFSARRSDVAKNRYDANHEIDDPFIKQLLLDQGELCIYCKKQMLLDTYEIRDNSLCTIERVDDSLGHIKNNCVLACLCCNMKKNNTRKNFQQFMIWRRENRLNVTPPPSPASV